MRVAAAGSKAHADPGFPIVIVMMIFCIPLQDLVFLPVWTLGISVTTGPAGQATWAA